MTVRDYDSRMKDKASKKYGTFSYLPPMDAAGIRRQVDYMIQQGWNCAIEHVEADRAGDDYWYMWKLPLFGERDVDAIMNELTSCREANPANLIRIVGYDNRRQTQGQSMVVYHGA
ncbi:ribulose bisphosphate carboxylase small subunit [Pelagibius litoralis]|uniref:Ribulose bisphosphate carboxylase small subunit n=2 Tax=Pelagibius litoralis TaxID=374515 RepID=A0A967C899_9PROT|nr:ribulose bisphosphate carboxylase small subunit [Pelagibius litoralis]